MDIKRVNKKKRVKNKSHSKKSKATTKTTSVSFREVLQESEDEKMRQKLEEILSVVEEKGKQLINHRTVENLLEYKKMVKTFVEEAVDYGLKLNARRGFGMSGRAKILRTVDKIDQRLIELTDIIVNNEATEMKILKKVGQIEGLLVNIYV